MSQHPASVVVVHQQVVRSNGLGIAGFILSLLGLLGTCGLLCPLGLLFSFVAVFKRPRGFAIAGLILGLIGSVWAFVAVFVIGVSALAAIVGIGALAMQEEALADMSVLAQAVEANKNSDGSVPTDLKSLPGVTGHLNDHWGHPYRMVLKKDSKTDYDIISDGPDGKPGTSDDISMREWSRKRSDWGGASGGSASGPPSGRD